MDFTKFAVYNSVFLPVAFDRNKSQHGKSFVKFPEEISGPGCFGSLSLGVLQGMGYDLKWKKGISKLLNVMRRYFSRATELRQTGTLSLYAKEPFATRFDKEQFDLGLLTK
eukprot:gene3766-7476_t